MFCLGRLTHFWRKQTRYSWRMARCPVNRFPGLPSSRCPPVRRLPEVSRAVRPPNGKSARGDPHVWPASRRSGTARAGTSVYMRQTPSTTTRHGAEEQAIADLSPRRQSFRICQHGKHCTLSAWCGDRCLAARNPTGLFPEIEALQGPTVSALLKDCREHAFFPPQAVSSRQDIRGECQGSGKSAARPRRRGSGTRLGSFLPLWRSASRASPKRRAPRPERHVATRGHGPPCAPVLLS